MTEIEKYSYNLPSELIAKIPASPRDHSRLLVFSGGKVHHDNFYNLGRYLMAGDLLVVNDSRVIPARLFAKKKTGGKIEILLLEQNGESWRVLIGGKVAAGENIIISSNFFASVLEKKGKEVIVKFNLSGAGFWRKIEKIGKMPIPPYIEKKIKDQKSKIKNDENYYRKRYQTVYAKEYGSAAAPTAGLHFSKKLIGELKSAGVNFATVNLHVGLGTFAPITSENILNKKLHLEKFSIPRSTCEKIIKAKNSGGRVIAIGTTTVRALESSAEKIVSGQKVIFGQTDIFIQPGFDFKIVDSLITNFHLPCSSLMMLVAAFLQHKNEKDGRKKLLELYKTAIDEKYRFYSFGDAMLVI